MKAIREGYYVPTDTEIHIGMQCDVFKGGKWKTVNVDSFGEIKEVFRNLAKCEVQVPYLSEAGFVSEGWMVEDDHYVKNNFTATYVADTERLEVFYKGGRIFAGKCKGLNTFQSISKMLRI